MTLLVVGLMCEEDLAGLRAIFSGSDWRLKETRSGWEALAFLDHHSVPLVISERNLPEGDDWRGLLQALQELPNPPYLIVSSRQADNRLWAEVLNLGRWDVLLAPFQAAEVIRVVRLAWLRWQREFGSVHALEAKTTGAS